MYEAFDSFMARDTWHIRHPRDENERHFYQTLNEIVWSDAFNPDEMADYMRARAGLAPDDCTSGLAVAIDRWRSDAWAVKEFLKYASVGKG
jgi:hypothetical protein